MPAGGVHPQQGRNLQRLQFGGGLIVGIEEIIISIALAVMVIMIGVMAIMVVDTMMTDYHVCTFVESHFPILVKLFREINPNQGDRKSLKAVLQNEQEPNVFVYYKRYHFIGFYEDKTQVHVYDFESSAEDVFKTLEKLHGKLLSIVEVL